MGKMPELDRRVEHIVIQLEVGQGDNGQPYSMLTGARLREGQEPIILNFYECFVFWCRRMDQQFCQLSDQMKAAEGKPSLVVAPPGFKVPEIKA